MASGAMNAMVGVRKLPVGCGGFALILSLRLIRALITSARPLRPQVCCWPGLATATKSRWPITPRANQPVPPKLVADMAAKDMDLQSPMPGPACSSRKGRTRSLEAGSLPAASRC